MNSSSSFTLGFTPCTPLLSTNTKLNTLRLSTCSNNNQLTTTTTKNLSSSSFSSSSTSTSPSTSPPSSISMTVSKQSQPRLQPPTEPISRRIFTTMLLSTATLLGASSQALADGITSQMVAYRDLPKGFTILRPSGWNEFEGSQDNYDIKWQDVIQPLEFVTVLTSPVDKSKQLSDLGPVATVGERLAKARTASLVSTEEKSIDGIPAYVIELKREQQQCRQITLLCINKMKLYSVNVSAPERRWGKREKLLRSVINSFKPRL